MSDVLAARPEVRLIWASPREILNVVQANQAGCHVITVTHDLLKKLSFLGNDIDQLSLRDGPGCFTATPWVPGASYELDGRRSCGGPWDRHWRRFDQATQRNPAELIRAASVLRCLALRNQQARVVDLGSSRGVLASLIVQGTRRHHYWAWS